MGVLSFKCSEKENKMDVFFMNEEQLLLNLQKDSWENLVSACNKCNLSKGNTLLKDTQMFLLQKPKKPHYLIYMQDYVLNNEYKSWKPYLYMV